MNLKKLHLVLALLTATAIAFAVEVDEPELKSAGNIDAVVFENYTGPHSVINSVSEIQSIGSGLGKEVAGNLDTQKTFGSSGKYSVIHCIDPKESGKLDADIMVIGHNATVDHIKNLRRIIASYLRSAYGYSEADSDTVATFVTVYNAVYRNNMNYFSSKYKKIVIDNLDSSKAGLALSYKDWPGKSQIVIPLSDVRGGLSTVDTSVISDKEVVKSMQEEDDKGIDSRKGMVDIKEREADKAQEKATEAQKKATEEKAKTDAAKKEAENAQKQAETAKKEAENAQKKAEEAQKVAEENPKDKEAQKQAEEAQKEAEQKAEEAKEAEQKAEEANQQVEQQQQAQKQAEETATTAQNEADKKRTEAQTERTTIAHDQQTVVSEQRKNDAAPSAYGLKAMDELGATSSIVRMNSDTGSLIKESPVTVIRNRTMYEKGDLFIAIAGVTTGNGAVKLVQIAKETMEIVKESNENIAENSVLVENGGNYYCVVNDGAKGCFVGKFDSDLKLLLKSNVPVKPATPITVTSGGVLVTSIYSKPMLLRLNDLTEITDGESTNTLSAGNIIKAVNAK